MSAWVISGKGVTPASCPFLPLKQTFASASDTPAMCHSRTFTEGRDAGTCSLLDHRYDLSQFPQPTFETCLVDSKVAASELGPRIHR